MNFISGEKIQYIADIVFADNYNPNNKKYSKKCVYVNEVNYDTIEKFNKQKVIYVRTDILDIFLSQIFPYLANNFVLITHNSDYTITDKYIEVLNDKKIISWFSQNIGINHPKLLAIPIGIANSQWKHGNLRILEKVINMNIQKNKLLYTNFKINTNKKVREYVKNIITNKGYEFIEPNLKWEDYLTDLASYKFSICPEGNGPDCHRIWESIYLGTIPIVNNIVTFKDFDDLPILKIDDWNTISNDFLNEQYKLIKSKKYNIDKLYLDYWNKLINQ